MFADRLAGRRQVGAQRLVVAEQADVHRAKRHAHRAGQRRRIDEVRRAEPHRVRQCVGEHQPTLGVGVDHLDRLAVHRLHYIAGARRRAARHVFDEAKQAAHALPDAEPRDRRDRPEHRRRAGHVVFHFFHRPRRLERQAAGVERDALADEKQV